MHQELLDIFTVSAASGVDRLPISDVISAIRKKLSVSIDKEALMSIIDVDQLKMVKSIDGDFVVFNKVNTVAQTSAEEKIKRDDKLVKNATAQASKQLAK